MKNHFIANVLLATSAAIFMTTTATAGVDAEAAKKLAKRSECLKCHAVDKAKVGPAYKNVASKYKGKADAEGTLVKFITTGPKIKLDDGKEQSHMIVDTKDMGEIKNLVGWILSQ